MSHWRPARLLRGGNGGREGARGGSFRETGGAEELLSAGPEPPPGGEAQEKLARRHGRRRRRRLRVCAYCLRSNLRTSERWRSPAPTATGGGGWRHGDDGKRVLCPQGPQSGHVERRRIQQVPWNPRLLFPGPWPSVCSSMGRFGLDPTEAWQLSPPASFVPLHRR